MIQNSWLELSAEAREQYEFRIALDPRVQFQVTEGKVEPDGLIGIVAYYKYETEKLPCCLCGAARHNGGAVVVLNDQTHRLIGNCCGKQHFQDDWNTSVNAFAKAERESNYRQKARLFFDDEYDILSAARALRPTARQAETARRSVRYLLGPEYSVIADELERNTGHLTYEILIDRDFRDQGTRGALTSTLAESDLIAGWEMFARQKWTDRIENHIGKFEQAFERLRDAFDRGHSLAGSIKRVRNCLDELLSYYEVFRRIRQYNALKNFDTLNFWFEAKGLAARLELEEKLWTCKDSAGSRSKDLPAIPHIEIPSTLKYVFDRIT